MPIWLIPRPSRFARRRHRHASGSIRYDDPRELPSVSYEDAGAVEGPFDLDERNPDARIENPTCSIAVVHAGYQGIEVWLDPSVADRATEVCDAVNEASGVARNVDELTD